MEQPMSYTVSINGQPHTVDVPADTPLLWVLRDIVGLTGTKFGCGIGSCGACTVHIDNNAVRSCVTPIAAVGDRAVSTIEMAHLNEVGKRVQAAWLEMDVVQCGYCQSGQIMSAIMLLSTNAKPSDDQIDAFMSGNICRCGTYPRIRAAIHRAAEMVG
jgi:isoquinoline 1-oxidoreductase alpha subunit